MMLDLFTSVSWLMRTIFIDWSGLTNCWTGLLSLLLNSTKPFSILTKDFYSADFDMPIKISQVGYNSWGGRRL